MTRTVAAGLLTSLLTCLLVASGEAFGATDDPLLYHDVEFKSQGATLSGTVFLPPGPAVAALVWVDGAGQTRRNPGLAQVLARRGIAVMTYDKRGVGKSGGVYAGPEVGTNNVSAENLALLSEDAAAALHALWQEKALRKVPLGFLGGSQAGWIIPVAALKRREARFMLFWSGAVETTHENLLFEQTAAADADFWRHHTPDEVRRIMTGVVDDLKWTDFDPRPALARLSIPGHWIFGRRDRNVDVHLSISKLDALIAQGHPGYSYGIFDEYDHWLGNEGEDVMAPSIEWIRSVTRQAH
jgi:pimeloyl-ACP methyl ester carboxylesterase